MINTTDRIKIGSLEVKGRIFLPPMATSYATPDGVATSQLARHYAQIAANTNVSLITVEHAFIMHTGMTRPKQLGIDTDDKIIPLRLVTEAIHSQGKPCFAQINHGGAGTHNEITGLPQVSPSGLPLVPSPVGEGTPLALDEVGIAEVIKGFGEAARRARESGFDGVEIHAAHGYLLNQFYSPLTNKREDKYGGSLENRIGIVLDIIECVRDMVGDKFPISVRLGGCDYMEGGSTIDDACNAAGMIERTGADMISLTGGMCRYERRGHKEPGYFSDMTRAVRQAVSFPVMLTGGIKTLVQARDLINSGAADIIGVGRAILKDKNWEV